MKISIKREQNNACIDSAEREKFGAKLKTLKNLIWMAAIALTAATWSACSNDDEPTTAEQPAQSRTFTVTTTLSPRDGGTRSTMTDNGDGSISAEWQVNDKVYVEYDNGGVSLSKTDATVTYVDPTTKAATITVTLTNPKNGGSITFGYPYSLFANQKSEYTDQTGTLADINANYASILGNGTLTVDGSNVTLPNVTMEPEMCIWKFTFTDGTSPITSTITKLVIELPSSGQKYTVSPSSQGTIYVAMHGAINAAPIGIYAQTATGVYRKTAASVTLASGKTYTSADLALKKAEVGKVFGEDGGIYDDAAAATTAGTTAVAMITYVGSDNCESSPYTHGLALAMSDANGGSKCQWNKFCSDAGHTKQTDKNNFTSESGLQYKDATHNTDDFPAFKAAFENNSTSAPTGCSAWFLPSAYQWNQMINACKNVLGTKNNYEDLRDGFNGVGGTDLQGDRYWSSTEDTGDYAWYYSFFNTGSWNWGTKSNNNYVRSAVAF